MPFQTPLHGNVLVSYEVLSEERRLVLRTESRGVQPPDRVDVDFRGVEAYGFRDDAFDNVVADVKAVPVQEILTAHGADLADSFRRKAAPGEWAENPAEALPVLEGRGVQGFVLSSSRGLSGWVLARSAAVVPIPRPVEPPFPGTPGIFTVSSTGERTRQEADGLMVVFDDDRELEIVPDRNASAAGSLCLSSRVRGRGGDGSAPADSYAAIVLYPGGGNLVAVEVQRRVRVATKAGFETVTANEEPISPRKAYFLVQGDERRAIDSEGFVFDLGEGRVVHVDRGDPAARATSTVRFLSGWMGAAADVERFRPDKFVSCGLSASFGGGNVVHLHVSRPHAVKPIHLVSPDSCA